MKKGFKVALIILSCILLLLGGLAFWQRHNIKVAWSGLTTSPEQLQQNMEEVKTEVESALTSYNLQGVRDLTVEEEEKLRKGEITLEEAMDLMMPARAVAETPEEEIVEAVNTVDTSTKEQQVEAVVAEYVGKMYTLKAKYVALLGSVESEAKSSFFSLPKEQQNIKGLQKIGGSFIGEAISLESQCNGEVGALLSELEQELKDLEADTSIVATMRKAYENEKYLKKAYYLSALQ